MFYYLNLCLNFNIQLRLIGCVETALVLPYLSCKSTESVTLTTKFLGPSVPGGGAFPGPDGCVKMPELVTRIPATMIETAIAATAASFFPFTV